MAASSGDDVPTQLAALLGKEVKDVAHIRKTDEEPPRAAIYDVISAVTGLNGNHAGKAYRDLATRHSEVHSIGVNFRFPGRGQRNPLTLVRRVRTRLSGGVYLPLPPPTGVGSSRFRNIVKQTFGF